MSNYILGVFVNHSAKTYSLTARPANHPDFHAMIETEAQAGFDFFPFAKNMEKAAADAAKAIVNAAYKDIGYTVVQRQPIHKT